MIKKAENLALRAFIGGMDARDLAPKKIWHISALPYLQSIDAVRITRDVLCDEDI